MQLEYGKFFIKLIVRTKIVALLAAALDLTRDLHLTSRGVAMNLFFRSPSYTLLCDQYGEVIYERMDW